MIFPFPTRFLNQLEYNRKFDILTLWMNVYSDTNLGVQIIGCGDKLKGMNTIEEG